MAGFPTCCKCIHGSWCNNPINDHVCMYSAEMNHSRDYTKDVDGKCADYKRRKAQKKPQSLIISENSIPRRECL